MDEEVKKEEKRDLTEKLRKNPWILSTFILVILVAVVLAGSLGNFSFTGNSISADEAGNLLMNAYPGISIDSVKEVSGLYQVNVLYQGQIVPLYVTKDGKYVGQMSLVSADASASSTNTGTQSQSGASTSNVSLQIPSFVPYLGSSSAKLNIVEFGDYQCPFCEKFFNEAESDIIKNYVDTGKARFYFMDFSFLGPDSNTLAEGAWCANDQAKYYAYHDYIYSHQGAENSGWATPDKLKVIVSKISGLNVATFSSCLDSGKYTSRVQQLTDLGRSVGVRGTPAVIINGQLISGAYPFSTFQQVIDQELASPSV